MKRNFEKGITLVALVVSIIILIILAGVSINLILGDNGIITKALKVKNIWNNAIQNDLNSIAELENQLNSKLEDNRIPISTAEQLLKIGTGEEISINEKIYVFKIGKTYVLQNDIEYTGSYENVADLIKNNEIEFNGQGHKIVVTNESGIKEYYTTDSKYYIATNKYGYVLNGLQLYYDGIDNVGEGLHSNTTTVWKDLSGNNKDGILNNFGTSCISGWNNKCLSLDGVNDWVNCGELNSENATLETVYMTKSNTNMSRCILGNWNSGGIGLFIEENFQKGELYYNTQYHITESINNMNKNELMTQSLTYNGQEGVLYIDGQETDKTTVIGSIEFPSNNTVMAIGGNPTGEDAETNIADIDVYTVRIYDRGLTKEEIEINNKVDNTRYKTETVIPIYTEKQLLKVGTGEQVTIEQENKTYTYATGIKYELKNDITVNGDYTSIINKINNKEIEIKSNDYKINNNGNYYTANSKYTIAVNKYGYVKDGLQLLLDGKDNTGTGTHSKVATTWKDLSQNKLDGTLQNMDIASCWENDGLKFDGIDDYVAIAEMNYKNVTLETVASIADVNGTTMDIVSNIQSGGYYIRNTSGNKFTFSSYITENKTYVQTPSNKQNAMIVNKKYSISGSYDGKIMKLRTSNNATTYQELITEGTIGSTTENTYMVLGANPKGSRATNDYLNGEISSVRIYNRALSDEENATNYLNDKERYEI